ncbi:pyridoxal phosphate-dependent aminotransferase [Mangrovihabitans endophyticus]|uniref:histidinol-phosphate transaminase n=1 Tax=Mangrovihabitans endophyticus TaxID=1751298 RepID=A0A8J3FKI0_9ACTN|nr:histidinol-phosphate transaminase [Mangrovihabitans endophyticus]GGK73038.1 hypothetical protein GCM10012284_03710 [Mangrovihabitans endophyticus]
MSRVPNLMSHHTLPDDDSAIRLHCNENPYGPPPGVIETAIKELETRCATYPDSSRAALRRRLAAGLGMPEDSLAIGNGADELVLITALALLSPGDRVLVTEGTFPGYAASAGIAHASVDRLPMENHRVPVDALTDALGRGYAVAYICNPHNPTGTVMEPADVERLIRAAEMAGTVAVFDEAYMEYAGPAYEYALGAVRDGRRLLVLRTFSKAWGLASLRIGYAAGPADLIARIRNVGESLPFSVNRPAQEAALAALGADDYLDDIRCRTAAARDRMCHGLAALGLSYVPSVTNFVLVRTPGDSTALARVLADQERVLVRDLTSFGLPGHLRITVGTQDQVDAVCRALREVLVTPAPHGTERAGLGASGAGIAPPAHGLAPSTLFNGYVGANVVFALNQLDVWRALQEGDRTLTELAQRTGSDPGKLAPLLRTAVLLGYLRLDSLPSPADPADFAVALTENGTALLPYRGFFTWGVGGYGEMLSSLAAMATGEARFGDGVDRDGGHVAVGSGMVGKSLMLTIEESVVADLQFDAVADLGCGDGSRLVRLSRRSRTGRGWGIEVDRNALRAAAERIAAEELTEQVRVVHDDLLAEDGRTFPDVDLVSSFLMMHDLFNATGDPAGVLRSLRRRFPDATRFLIADTVGQNWAAPQDTLPIFSVGFELLHAYMDVPILSLRTYEDAFTAAGLTALRREPFGAPSTWLWLLSTGAATHERGASHRSSAHPRSTVAAPTDVAS